LQKTNTLVGESALRAPDLPPKGPLISFIREAYTVVVKQTGACGTVDDHRTADDQIYQENASIAVIHKFVDERNKNQVVGSR